MAEKTSRTARHNSNRKLFMRIGMQYHSIRENELREFSKEYEQTGVLPDLKKFGARPIQALPKHLSGVLSFMREIPIFPEQRKAS
jgi:hypothetical protein